ncbi:MAG: hypothetical protein JW838_06665 [Spirochaetes bacterium]|nr:hypothetical protein [Spirochaetota bacterium]
MCCRRNILAAQIQIALFIFATCGLTTEREQAVLAYSTERNMAKYADLLVEEERYTTDGLKYQKKYYRHLIGIAGEIVESRKLSIEKHSIGFYYDKRSGDTRSLYLGFDVDAGTRGGKPFERIAVELIRSDLANIVQTIHACRSVFNEKDMAGMVIGWKWTAGAAREHLSVWISKVDFIRYEDDLLTFDGMLQRSTITNTRGRVIRLPL